MKSLKINRSDKAPNFTMGGNRTVTRSGAKAGTLIFGTEFGSNNTSNFHHVAQVKGVVIVAGLFLLLWNVSNQLLCENG
jgi:hypothetical protein